ncbi:MAG TPA: ABC transporter permease, partial [Nocardioides sp.]|nr:ABC transporter permease [Nocardioides sp.]
MATLTTVRSVGATLVQERRDRIEEYGDQLLFYVKALAWTPRAVRRYRREIYNTLAEVAFGAGGLTLIAGTVGVIAFLAFFAGTEVGIQGYASLSQIGVAKFTAFISAYFNTREVAPLVSSIALAATVGCGYTARLGAMRISEEIDALEVMGIPSLPYLVTTRMIAAFVAVIPLYVVALSAS